MPRRSDRDNWALNAETENFAALNDRGSVLLGSNRFEEALASFDQALAIKAEMPRR